MEESHKTTALKKAYAEIILNTAKESAARVMLSDRKSARFHHDLSETKEEALRLLVRLKHMIDAKTIEGDVISSNQQRQIDVLEAQLHEAEDIITDLRSEVRWVRDRLEKAKASESQERNAVSMEEEEEEEEETVSVHPEVVAENEEKQFDGLSMADTLKAYESQERNVVREEDEEMVSVHKVDPEVILESSNPNQEDRSSLDDVECEDGESLEKAKASELQQERNVVDMEEEMVSAHKVVLESVNPNLEDHSSLHDAECESLEKAKAYYESQERNLVVNKEEETVSAHKVDQKVVVESLKPDQEVADTCFSHEKHFDGLSVVDTVMGNAVSESESDGDIRIKKLELSRNGCTQRIHALERIVLDGKSSSSADEEEQQRTTDKDSEESLISGKAGTLGNTRCLVLALRASSAEVVTLPSNALGIKKARKLRGRRKKRFGKPKAKSVRSQSQLIKPCQSQSNATCSKTSTSDGEDSIETHLSVESEEVGDLKTCKELKEHLQRKRTLDSDVLVSCEGEEESVVPSTKMASESKVTAVVVSDQISESPPRANVNRLLKYTFQRKRKRGSADDSNNLPRKHQENKAQDQTESTLSK
ncbi:hypothetical protein Bca4012_078780 [Brassica carinata]|uniref:Uncharacterized protein n=1 Tax=Brassica carinata TaxID=52824 RepID=A0A8X7QAU0_BRACI|nr:hypothetical protein Bca52824_071208 [Brassica carinata]